MHNRKLVLGSVGLVIGSLKNTSCRLKLRDDLEMIMIHSNYLEGAPFKWVGLIYRYGLKNMTKPEYQRINKKYGDIPIAVELKMEILQWADANNIDLLKEIFAIGALDALIDIGRKYKLPIDAILLEREKYGLIPESIQECEAWVQKTPLNVEALIEPKPSNDQDS